MIGSFALLFLLVSSSTLTISILTSSSSFSFKILALDDFEALLLCLSFLGGLFPFFFFFSASSFLCLNIFFNCPHILIFFLLVFLLTFNISFPPPILRPKVYPLNLVSLLRITLPNINISSNLSSKGFIPVKQNIKRQTICNISTNIHIIPP